MLAVTDGAGNVLETYTHGADLSGQVGGAAGGIGGILASTQVGGAAYYHYDFNGNVVSVSGSTQTQLAKYTYGPFGEVLLEDGLFDSRYQFSTKEYDSTTGLNYYGYRYYSPSLGKWLSLDPLGNVSDIHLYIFINNNVILHTDYLGLFEISLNANSLSDLNTTIEQEMAFFENCTSDPAPFTFHDEIHGKVILGKGIIPGGAELEGSVEITIGPIEVEPCGARKVIGILKVSTSANVLPLIGLSSINMSIGHRLESYKPQCKKK